MDISQAHQQTKVAENRLRRMAERQGLRLTRSRRRDIYAPDYGKYALVKADVDTPEEAVTYTLSMADVEKALTPPLICYCGDGTAYLARGGKTFGRVSVRAFDEDDPAYFTEPVPSDDQIRARMAEHYPEATGASVVRAIAHWVNQ